MLERQWLQRNQQLSRIEEEKKQLAQMNDALVPQMEKMLGEVEELNNKVAHAETRAVRAEQDLVATRQALQALQSEHTKYVRAGKAQPSSPAAERINMVDRQP